MKIQIEIDKLVLDGFAVSKREAALIKRSVETELTRLVTESGVHAQMQSPGALARVAAPDIPARHASPGGTGEAIARSVYAGLGKS